MHSLKFAYKGESRSWSFFLYPQSIFSLFDSDIVLLEGTTNLINNSYLIIAARVLGKKIIWWDAGYSPQERTKRRKVIDCVVSAFICMTHKQISYSTKAQRYMEQYMGAKHCVTILNTISTAYFKAAKQEIIASIGTHQLDEYNIKLLCVGSVEERKKILELIILIKKLNQVGEVFSLTVIGDGNYLETCKKYVCENGLKYINFTGSIVNKEKLKTYYFSSDLLVMPGDGGLAIAQSLLFGLPAVCVVSDGTEEDYIDNKSYILEDFDELEEFLLSFTNNYDRKSVLNAMERLQDTHFISSMVKLLTE